jgi:AcrR family transcriptional regulator
MSQIRYHFGSKEGMVLALFQYMNQQLIARQSDLFTDPAIPLSEKWNQACDYLDQDLASGYVRVLQEMIAVGWSNETIGDAVRRSLRMWRDLHVALAEEFRERHGSLGPFEPEDIAALVGQLFIGGENYVRLGSEAAGTPVRQAQRKIGRVLKTSEREGGAD